MEDTAVWWFYDEIFDSTIDAFWLACELGMAVYFHFFSYWYELLGWTHYACQLVHITCFIVCSIKKESYNFFECTSRASYSYQLLGAYKWTSAAMSLYQCCTSFHLPVQLIIITRRAIWLDSEVTLFRELFHHNYLYGGIYFSYEIRTMFINMLLDLTATQLIDLFKLEKWIA